MKFRNPNATDCVIDAMCRVDDEHYDRTMGKRPVRMLTFNHQGWRQVLHSCDHYLISQGTIDPHKMTFMGCPVTIVREQEDPFHIWVQQ